MAMEMEGVDCCVVVVEYKFDNLACWDDERIYGAIDEGIGVVGAGADGCVKRWDVLVDVSNVV